MQGSIGSRWKERRPLLGLHMNSPAQRVAAYPTSHASQGLCHQGRCTAAPARSWRVHEELPEGVCQWDDVERFVRLAVRSKARLPTFWAGCSTSKLVGKHCTVVLTGWNVEARCSKTCRKLCSCACAGRHGVAPGKQLAVEHVKQPRG